MKTIIRLALLLGIALPALAGTEAPVSPLYITNRSAAQLAGALINGPVNANSVTGVFNTVWSPLPGVASAPAGGDSEMVGNSQYGSGAKGFAYSQLLTNSMAFTITNLRCPTTFGVASPTNACLFFFTTLTNATPDFVADVPIYSNRVSCQQFAGGLSLVTNYSLSVTLPANLSNRLFWVVWTNMNSHSIIGRSWNDDTVNTNRPRRSMYYNTSGDGSFGAAPLYSFACGGFELQGVYQIAATNLTQFMNGVAVSQVSNATQVSYDATASGLAATTVQAALDAVHTEATNAASSEIDVFLIAGQSNAQGYGSNTQSVVPPVGVALQYDHGLSAITGDPVGNANNGSAWPSFITTYYLHTGRKLCLVPWGVASTAMAAAADGGAGNWDDTGTMWTNATSDTAKAMADLSALGLTPVFKGILWCQGEQDGLKIGDGTITQATFAAALTNLIYRAGTNFGATTPFYIFRTGRRLNDAHGDVGYVAVREVQEAVCSNYTRMVFFDAVNYPELGLMSPDASKTNAHYSQVGYNLMGQRAAENILASISGFSHVDELGVGVSSPRGTGNLSVLNTNSAKMFAGSGAGLTNLPVMGVAGSASISTATNAGVVTPSVADPLSVTTLNVTTMAYQTNSSSLSPNFAISYQLFSTNAGFAFASPINASASTVNACVVLVTNSTPASPFAVTAPATVSVQGTWYVTNLTVFSWVQYGMSFTNATALPLK